MSMPLKELTPAEVRRADWEALREKLGPASAIKFILDYDRGRGNYSKLRKKIFEGKTVRDIVQDMEKEGCLWSQSYKGMQFDNEDLDAYLWN